MARRTSHRKPDHHSREARRSGYPARSVFKLQEIDRRFGVLHPGCSVLDLGAAPGSWTLYSLGRVGGGGSVTAIDRAPLPAPLRESLAAKSPLTYLAADMTEPASMAPVLTGRMFDVVLSDAAPNTTGSGLVDAARSRDLFDAACCIAGEHLSAGGKFVAKLLQGEDVREVLDAWRPQFAQLRTAKPAASRAESRELFIVGTR